MSQEKTTLEIIAPTVDEAVQKGLNQLGLPLDAVEVEVLDAGSRGLFGFGSRQARIRLSIKASQAIHAPEPAAAVEVATTPQVSAAAVETAPAASAEPLPEESVEEDATLRVSRQVVQELLEKMKISARVVTRYLPGETENDQPVVLADIQGDDLSILIGRRSETLNALQYISSLIIGKEVGHWVALMIDVQGYRTRRERQLRQMARRMADQTVHTGKRQVMEPMPANERRIIHLELRDHPQVATESLGEEPNRKVSIYLKK